MLNVFIRTSDSEGMSHDDFLAYGELLMGDALLLPLAIVEHQPCMLSRYKSGESGLCTQLSIMEGDEGNCSTGLLWCCRHDSQFR